MSDILTWGNILKIAILAILFAITFGVCAKVYWEAKGWALYGRPKR
ncbi:hypothetical protein KNU78_gp15 [Gordonia phage Sukkupi]|uniref:Uncharacterized protein n=1 Tax=Gordonia phage Sukkupi TaxID=2653747 RepID=A0A5Q2WN14_9CAUD|nr:hypothetical protein KNU78_gp15 [Gordonia phage Sukkupi]QAU07064.1 hypothetical protein SEA_BIPAUNETO_15 [Gordonia phage BiPauneto]QGH79258.1 hypothetical protein SEA_SUKKUPI_15 [Gordonia phage Sukkupi]QGH80731.1 hypothetical protein SEA_YNDEXA_15 [Gordonia phage Yndexa]